MRGEYVVNKNMEIIFVRHGQSYGNIYSDNKVGYNPDNPALTEEGLRQAKLLSKRFERGDINRIFSSTLTRAVQTACPTAEKLGMQIELIPDLVEVGTKKPCIDFETQKKETPLVYPVAPKLLDSGFGDETTVQAFERAQRCLDYIFSVCKDNERILVVSHGTFMGCLVKCALGLDAKSDFRLQVDNCSITHIAFFENGTPKLKTANDTVHLL